MKASEITVETIRQVSLKSQSPFSPPSIHGVRLRELKPWLDGRGEVTEMWSFPWIQSSGFTIPKHIYQSATDYGVVKAWHLHEIHTDQFVVVRGKLQVLLFDLRPESPTFGHLNCVFMGIQAPRLLLIPPMVLHGWKALTAPEVVVLNLQSEVYDPSDEFKYPWDCLPVDLWEPRNG